MAQIILLLREESTQNTLENGTAGVGALQLGELGYTEAAQEFSYKNRVSGAIRHVPTREKLLLAAAAATSGSKGIGYFPASGLTSVTVQDALDELRAQVAAGGGGTTLGAGTAGALTKWVNSATLGDSILTEAGSAIRFSGDTVANLYRSSSAYLKTDGHFITNLSLAANNAYVGINKVISTPADGEFQNTFYGSFERNDTGAIEHSLLKVKANLNAGGSNSNEILNLIEVNTSNPATTGMTVNLMNLNYGNVTKFKVSSAGNVLILGAASIGPLTSTSVGLLISSDAIPGNTAIGLQSVPKGTTANTSLMSGGVFGYETAASQALSLGIGLRIFGPSMGGGASVVDHRGLVIENQGSYGSSTNFAIQTGTGIVDFGDRLITKLSTTSKAGLNIPHGTAPTIPVDGDVWTDGGGMYVRVSGVTLTIASF